MNKVQVDKWIPPAYDLIKRLKIAEDNKVDKGFRSQISSFGAALQMGSVLSAVTFFTKEDKSRVDRHKLMTAIYYLIFPPKEDDPGDTEYPDERLFVALRDKKTNREEVCNAAVAVKLALNLFELKPGKDGDGGDGDE